MAQPRPLLCVGLDILQKADVGEINLLEPPEVKKVDDNGNADGQQTKEEIWIDELHR